MSLRIHYLILDCGPASNLEGGLKVQDEVFIFELRETLYSLHEIFFVLNKIDRGDLILYAVSRRYLLVL